MTFYIFREGDIIPEPPATDISIGEQPNMPTQAKISIHADVNDGVLSAGISEQTIKDAIKAAQDAGGAGQTVGLLIPILTVLSGIGITKLLRSNCRSKR